MSLEDTLYPLLRLYEKAPQPVKSIAGRAYRALPTRLRYGSNYTRFSHEARDSESWSADEIIAYQTKALRESLLAAWNAPFYRKRFSEHGVDPTRFESIDQLKDYPLLTKQDLISERENMVSSQTQPKDRLYITTGGSSGIPVGFYLQKGVSRPKEQAYLEAQWSRRGWRPGDRTAVIRGSVTARGGKNQISYYDATRNWLILSSYHLTPDRLPEYVAELNRFRPLHLHAYPSAALMLARGLEETRTKLNFTLTSILCGSEKLTREDQAYLESFFGAPVLHWYGHSERVVLAAEGRKSNDLFFWPGYGFVEFSEPNEQGHREIIGTSFHNHVMPLIRYRTGDYVAAVHQDNNSELRWPRVEAVIGRDYEFLVSATGRRISLTAINMHDQIFDHLLAVQFYQEKPGSVQLRLQPGPNWQSSRLTNIHSGVMEKLGTDFALDIILVDEVEKTAMGKHRWLITRL